LALYGEQAATAPAPLAAHIEHPLETRATRNALGFALHHIAGKEIRADSEWVVERELTRSRQQRAAGASQQQNLRNLTEMLSQSGFEIDIEPENAPTSPAETVRQRIDEQGRREIRISDALRFPPRKAPYSLTAAGRNWQLAVWPMSARPDLNRLDEDSLERYLQILGLAPEAAGDLAARLSDWRDRDSFSRVRASDGVFYYGRAAFTPRNGAIESWGELAHLSGAQTPGLIPFLRRHFVIHGQGRAVHPDFLPAEAIAALADVAPETARMALDHLRLPPAERQRARSLTSRLGPETARRLRQAITFEYDPDATRVLVRLAPAEGGEGIEAVFDVETERVLSQRRYTAPPQPAPPREES